MTDRDGSLAAGAKAWLERFMMSLPRGGVILDLGCGAGEPIARYLIDHGFRIVGIDLSETRIDLARVRFPDETWLIDDMRRVEIDAQFDGVLAWNCLSQLPHADQDAMIARAAAWMKPDGRLLFNAKAADTQTLDGFRPGSRFRDDLETADYGDALARRGLIEMAHDAACDGAAVWLARKI